LKTEDDEAPPKKVAKKQYRKICSTDGCPNIAQKGGVCIKHGAKHKRCSNEGCTNRSQKGGVCIKHGAKIECKHEGCTNHAQKGGVCKRHGAYRNPHKESTAFTSYLGSEFEKTTATHPVQHASKGPTRDSGLPEVVVCNNVVTENYEEV
jgi:hypothetical protein